MGIQLDQLGYIALRFVKASDVNRKKIVIIALYIICSTFAQVKVPRTSLL